MFIWGEEEKKKKSKRRWRKRKPKKGETIKWVIIKTKSQKDFKLEKLINNIKC